MAIYQRPDSPYHWTRFQILGERIRESTGIENTPENEELAQEYEDRLKVKIRDKIKARQQGVIWQAMVLNYLKQPDIKAKRSLDSDISRLNYCNGFLRDKPHAEIDEDLVYSGLDSKLKRGEDGEQLDFQPTANRYISVINGVLTKAFEKGLVPAKITIPSFPESKGVIRWITRDEADRLLLELRRVHEHQSNNAFHLADMAEFTLATGLREANVRLLKWSNINLENKTAWIHAAEFKQGVDHGIPLNDDALKILHRLRGTHKDYVFTFNSESVAKCSTKAWYKAMKRANIDNFRWHDLRHTWASWHVQAGTSLQKLMELGGWKSYESVLRYAHLNKQDLHNDANNVTRKVELRLVQ